jgi:predicted HTH domain antitoxin
MQLTVDLPDDVFRTMDVSPGRWENEARKEVALGFYARGLISLGKAVEMSGASRMEFEGWLGERKIVRPFSEEDLRHELDWDWSEPEG